MLISAAFCYELTRYIPTLSNVLKYVGAIYIIWLAIHVARSKPEESEEKQISFSKAFFLQFFNVKIIMYASTIYTGYVIPVSGDFLYLVTTAISITVIGVFGIIVWAVAGGLLQKFLTKHYRSFNLTIALILFVCAIKLVV